MTVTYIFLMIYFMAVLYVVNYCVDIIRINTPSRFRRRRRCFARAFYGCRGIGRVRGFGYQLLFAWRCTYLASFFSWISKAPGKRAEEASGSPRGDAKLAVWAQQYARVGSEARLYPWMLGVVCGQVQPGSEAS